MKCFTYQNCGSVETNLTILAIKRTAELSKGLLSQVAYNFFHERSLFGSWRHCLQAFKYFECHHFFLCKDRNFFELFEVCFHLLSSCLTLKSELKMWEMCWCPLLPTWELWFFSEEGLEVPFDYCEGAIVTSSWKVKHGERSNAVLKPIVCAHNTHKKNVKWKKKHLYKR